MKLFTLFVGALFSFFPSRAESLRAAITESSFTRAAIVTPLNDVVFPTIIAKGGWKTSFVLVNLGASDADFKIVFATAKGDDMVLLIVGIGNATFVRIRIPARGTYTLETGSWPNEDAVEGWGMLLHDGISGTTGKIGGHVVLKAGDRETVVPISTGIERVALLPYDLTNGNETWANVVNFDPASATLTISIFDENGRLVSKDNVVMSKLERMSFNFSKVSSLVGTRGVIKFESSAKTCTTFGFRYNGNIGFVSVPTISLAEWQYY